MNATFPAIKEYMEGASGLDWLAGKFKVYGVDMDTAGPASGAWKISTSSTDTSDPISGYPVTFTTSAAHGLSAGDKIAMFGNTTKARPWAASARTKASGYVTPTVLNGKRYRTLNSGSLGASQPTWPTTDGEVVLNGNVALICDGSDALSPFNANWTISAAPSTTTLRFDIPYAPLTAANGYIANLTKTYLSDFAPSGSRVASAALTGKSILTGGVLDASDFTLDGGGTSREALVLAKAAALDADTDLADTAQRLVAYWDTMSGLPIAAGSGPGTYSISNGADRLLRL